MRLRQKPWADDSFLNNKFYLPNPKEINFKEIFKNNNPIHLEIGCGKGQFVIQTALANPDINYIAIEKEERIICMSVKNAAENASKLQNLYFFKGNAENLLEYFKDTYIERLYINFCDPWRNRAKWFKRRLTHRNFLNIYTKIMPVGSLHFKTDDRDLFNFSVNELKEMGWNICEISYNLHEKPNKYIITEYESRFIAQNKPIHRLVADTPSRK